MFDAPLPEIGRTWVGLGGESFGARADERGPIGGGAGYADAPPEGDCRVTTLDELLEALAKARPGEVLFVEDGVEMDCTERVYIERLVIEIPGGVTLAGGQGRGASRGALIGSDTFATRPLIRAAGPDVRVTGLRLRGPDPKRRMEHHHRGFREGRGRAYYDKFPISDGISTEHAGLQVDNCELAGWSHAAVYLQGGGRHHIHHNYMHHNQYNGLGYGVCLGKAVSLIEHNVFNYNRHSIAGTGEPGCAYEARHNVEVEHSLSHCFDMHGGADRKDGTEIAGDWMKIHHNTFRSARTAVKIRGLAQQGAEIHHNWFYHGPGGEPVVSPGKTRLGRNAHGLAEPQVL